MRTKFKILKDKLEVLFGMRHPLLPPRRYDYINKGDNLKISKEFLKYFIEFGKITPESKILEIGSGYGRMAVPLTKYLSGKGEYFGIDIFKDGINWCKKKITKKHSNFKFKYIDIYNSRYNNNGKINPKDFKFPFGNETFDFIYLTSVFTHMEFEEIRRYMYEISRVLKKGGRCLITFYILNPITDEVIKKGKFKYSFRYNYKNGKVENISQPMYQIAFPERTIIDLYKSVEIDVITPINYGSWSGRKDSMSFQDIIIGKKIIT